MSRHVAFRRQPVDQQAAQNLRTLTFPAPTRGIIQNENESYMQPGGCIVCDNWAPTLRGVKLRGGSIIHCDLHSLDAPGWANSTAYAIGDRRYDNTDGSFWDCAVAHTSEAAPTTFAQSRALHPGPAPAAYWTNAPFGAVQRQPIISAFEYVSAGSQRMYAGQPTKLYDVTDGAPLLIKDNQTSGNYVAAQFANQAASSLGTNWMIVCNETGDYPLRFDGTAWVVLDPTSLSAPTWLNSTAYAVDALARDPADNSYWKCLVGHTSDATGTFAEARAAGPTLWGVATATDDAGYITGPPGTAVADGRNLSYVWKYRNRLFFVEAGSMNAWYLDINSIGGRLTFLPLAGSASRGGKLLFGASWSLDAGDGLSEYCIFVTDLGEVLIFEGTNPGDVNNWRQHGRYQLSAPMGMNAHLRVGGDLMIMTVDGIIPLSQAVSKDVGQLELAMLTRTIRPLWRTEVATRGTAPWTIKKWDEYNAVFVAVPGGIPGDRHCLLANNATGAWGRFLGWDATCWARLRADMFFGTQDGAVMQADRTGYDSLWDTFSRAFVRRPYVATMVGGWEMFGATANQVVWHQARATFKAGAGEPFEPQLSATINYELIIPPPPFPGPDPGPLDVWDQGKWGPERQWLNNHPYAINDEAYDVSDGTIWRVTVAHTSAAGGTFAADRAGSATGKWVNAQLPTPSPLDIELYAQWDQPAPLMTPVRNTLWISIGMTGYAHAPIVQVQIAQQVTPSVELIAISTTYEPAGVNV
jgi:hypothetical protein